LTVTPATTHTGLFARLTIVAWTVLWIAAVPLFHTHLPDIADQISSQRGVAHTVFSPDLPGEFIGFSSSHDGPFANLSTHVMNSPELGFVLSSCDTKDREVGEGSVLNALHYPSDPTVLQNSAVESSVVAFRPHLLSTRQSPRAPPIVIC
jgi:hypothetical protein